jgi:hypothetical protein
MRRLSFPSPLPSHVPSPSSLPDLAKFTLEEPPVLSSQESRMTLTQLVESRIRTLTHGRIRDLKVEEIQGCVVVRGNVPSHHTKQLALHGALELLSGDRFSSEITVG